MSTVLVDFAPELNKLEITFPYDTWTKDVVKGM